MLRRIVDSAHHRFHEARARLFVYLMKPRQGARLLDLGGGNGALSARICRHVPLDVTVADLETHHASTVEARGFRHVQLSEDAILPFGDGEFDLVLSNSVIEHVTLPKQHCRTGARVPEAEWIRRARESQSRFACELRRVGRAYFVQTPHKHFPIDAHVQLPLVQYLSHNAACRLVEFTDRFWIKSCWGIVDWHLLIPREMQSLFPDATIRVERLAGLPKSIIAYRS